MRRHITHFIVVFSLLLQTAVAPFAFADPDEEMLLAAERAKIQAELADKKAHGAPAEDIAEASKVVDAVAAQVAKAEKEGTLPKEPRVSSAKILRIALTLTKAATKAGLVYYDTLYHGGPGPMQDAIFAIVAGAAVETIATFGEIPVNKAFQNFPVPEVVFNPESGIRKWIPFADKIFPTESRLQKVLPVVQGAFWNAFLWWSLVPYEINKWKWTYNPINGEPSLLGAGIGLGLGLLNAGIYTFGQRGLFKKVTYGLMTRERADKLLAWTGMIGYTGGLLTLALGGSLTSQLEIMGLMSPLWWWHIQNGRTGARLDREFAARGGCAELAARLAVGGN